MSGLTQPVPPLILALQNPTVYPHPVDTIKIMQTHISWVILTGQFAYKIKKPVHFNFLDYSTLDKRHHYCQEELKLNKTCAAPLYKAVVPLYGSAASPSFTPNDKPPFEYAIQMQEFPQEALLLPVLSRLGAAEQIHLIDKIAHYLAGFHKKCPRADYYSSYGIFRTIYQPIDDNIKDIKRFSKDPKIRYINAHIPIWLDQQYSGLIYLFSSRKVDGFTRQCHGDLRLNNIVYLNDTVYCFDRVEFNPDLQWIDVMSDLAFLLMDLEFHGFKHLSYRLLNTYMRYSGDYSGLPLLPVYKVYRATVCAKIALLETPQKSTEALAYLDYTRQLMQQKKPQLILMHGFSGSGKSHLSAELAPRLNCIILQSDLYRRYYKQFHCLRDKTKLYTQKNIDIVYAGLLALTAHLLKQKQSVWVDASFLKKTHRDKFISLAKNKYIPWAILDVQAPYALLTERLAKRPPSEARIQVLDRQIATQDPLSPSDSKHVVTVDTEASTAHDALVASLQGVLF